MVPITREGIRFGLRAGVLWLDGVALTGDLPVEAPPGELRQLIRTAAVVGRWLAKTEEPSTAFALLGVTP